MVIVFAAMSHSPPVLFNARQPSALGSTTAPLALSVVLSKFCAGLSSTLAYSSPAICSST